MKTKKPEKMMKPSSKIKGMMLFPSLEANTGKKAAAVDKKHEQEEEQEVKQGRRLPSAPFAANICSCFKRGA